MKKIALRLALTLALIVVTLGDSVTYAADVSTQYVCDKSSRRAFYTITYSLDNIPEVDETDWVRLELVGEMRNVVTGGSRKVVLTHVGNGVFKGVMPMYKVGEYAFSFNHFVVTKYVNAVARNERGEYVSTLLTYDMGCYTHSSYFYVINK